METLRTTMDRKYQAQTGTVYQIPCYTIPRSFRAASQTTMKALLLSRLVFIDITWFSIPFANSSLAEAARNIIHSTRLFPTQLWLTPGRGTPGNRRTNDGTHCGQWECSRSLQATSKGLHAHLQANLLARPVCSVSLDSTFMYRHTPRLTRILLSGSPLISTMPLSAAKSA